MSCLCVCLKRDRLIFILIHSVSLDIHLAFLKFTHFCKDSQLVLTLVVAQRRRENVFLLMIWFFFCQ